MQAQIYNSTFENHFTKPEIIWGSGTSSLSSIEKVFDPIEIKKIVDDLVMSRFGLRSKTPSRRYLGSTSDHSDFSVDTSNLSELISNQHQSVTTLDFNRHSLKTPEEFTSGIISECSTENTTFETLQNKLVILNEIKEQILKAIHYDDTVNGGVFSRERLEAEKLLLITDTEIDSIFSELGNTCEDNTGGFCSGTLNISRVHLWPKEPYNFDQYFICVVTYGPKVYASKLSKIKFNGGISFKGKFNFCGLPPDFEIAIKIYSCPVKIFKNRPKSFTCDYHNNSDEVPLRQSLFTLFTETSIRLCDLDKSGTLKLNLNSGLLTAFVSTSANLNMNLSGFVNVSENRGKYPLWNRQWSCLKGRIISYYNYPPADETCEGVAFLDLSVCKEVRAATREESPRKQTLLLETKSGKRILISCESRFEFEFWEEYLKRAVLQLSLWE